MSRYAIIHLKARIPHKEKWYKLICFYFRMLKLISPNSFLFREAFLISLKLFLTSYVSPEIQINTEAASLKSYQTNLKR